MPGGLRPAHDCLNKLRIMTMGNESATSDVGKVLARPSSLLRNLDKNTVTREEGADDGTDEVVEGIVPADKSSNNTKRFIVDSVALVHHEKVGRTTRRAQCSFTMVESPLELLSCDKNLSQLSIHHSLSTVQASNLDNVLSIVENVLQQRAQHGTAFLEGCLSPYLLRSRRGDNSSIDSSGCRRVDLS